MLTVVSSPPPKKILETSVRGQRVEVDVRAEPFVTVVPTAMSPMSHISVLTGTATVGAVEALAGRRTARSRRSPILSRSPHRFDQADGSVPEMKSGCGAVGQADFLAGQVRSPAMTFFSMPATSRREPLCVQPIHPPRGGRPRMKARTRCAFAVPWPAPGLRPPRPRGRRRLRRGAARTLRRAARLVPAVPAGTVRRGRVRFACTRAACSAARPSGGGHRLARAAGRGSRAASSFPAPPEHRGVRALTRCPNPVTCGA